MLDWSSFFAIASSSADPTKRNDDATAEAYDREVILCPSTASESCTHKTARWTADAKEILVKTWTETGMPTTLSTADGLLSLESVDEHNSMTQQSYTSSVLTQPRIMECLSDPEDIPRELVFYRRKRDWDLPRHVHINWHRETNVKHFYGIHKWMGQLCYSVGDNNNTVIGTIVCYELQPLASVRKSGHGAVLLRSLDSALYKLSLLAASTKLQSETLWSDHWDNLPLMLISNVYVPPPYRGLGLGLALLDDACRKPGRDIPWILTATTNPTLQDYFCLLGFHAGIFGDAFGARWNDLDRGRLPKINDLCPHLPTSSVVVSQPEEGEPKEKTTEDYPECPREGCEDDEDDLFVEEHVVLSNFQATSSHSSSQSRRRRRRVWQSHQG